MKLILEVGANAGRHTELFLEKYKTDYLIVSFEPIVKFVHEIEDRYGSRDNFIINAMAIDIENGVKKFNINELADWGCSSLYDFNPNILEEWPGRPDFHHTKSTTVICMRLDHYIDTFLIKKYDIEEITYLHIDAQGNDYRVLQSLGKYIDIVKSGVCEVTLTTHLYDKCDNTLGNVRPWLNSKGFITKVVPDEVGKEADIFFEKR